MNQKASDLFIACLLQEGVKYIFGVPGEENLDLIESLRTSSIELIITRNEQTAVFMAATYGRLTGKAGVALATLWPGATNMVTGVAYAQLGGMPIIVITGQKPIKQSKQWRFQVLDVVSMMEPITKHASSIANIHRIPSTIRQAFKLAEEEKPWAVHIELAEDIAKEIDEETIQPIKPHKIRRPQIDEKMRQKLIIKLQNAKHPLILIGSGANRKRITNYLTKFIQKTNIPFFTSQMGKGVVSEDLPQCLGTAALTSGDYIHEIIEQADCILTIGYDLVEKPGMIKHNQEIIHINFFSAIIDQLYTPSLEVIGDIGNTLWQLYESDELHSDLWDFTEIYIHNKKNKLRIEQTTQEEYTHKILWPRRLAKDLRKILQPSDILALDNGLYKVWLARNYQAMEPNTVLLDNALATMGAGIGTSIIAKMLNPNKQVVCVVGDGWLVMNLGDLKTAVNLWLDLVIIILNDNAYGMIKRKQQNMWFQDYALDLENPDFTKLAKAFWA